MSSNKLKIGPITFDTTGTITNTIEVSLIQVDSALVNDEDDFDPDFYKEFAVIDKQISGYSVELDHDTGIVTLTLFPVPK